MPLILTPIVTDNFTPDSNPLNPVNWVTFPAFTALQALGGTCQATSLATTSGANNQAVLPNDQYCSVTLAAFLQGSGNDFGISVRGDNTSGSDGYILTVIDNLVPGQVTISLNGGFLPGVSVDLPFAIGDVFTIAAVGPKIYVLQNGLEVLQATDFVFNGGLAGAGIDVFTANLADVQMSNFVAGGAVSVGGASGFFSPRWVSR